MSSYSQKQSLFFLWFLIIAMVAAFVFINWPFLTPLILAGIFALGLHDLVSRLARRTRAPRSLTIVLTLLSGIFVFWVAIWLAGYRAFTHIVKPEAVEKNRVVEQFHTLKNFALHNIQELSDWTGFDLANPAREFIETTFRRAGEIALKFSSDFVSQLPIFLLGSFVFVLLLLGMMLKAEKIRDFVMRYSPLASDLTNSLIDIAKNSCKITLFSTLVVGLVQASIIGLGSLIFGEGDFWLVLSITFVVSFIPVIGASPVGYILALLAYLGDRTGSAVGLFIVASFSGLIDNLLKPFLIGRENNTSPIIGFTCVIGAILMMGLPGLLVGPVVVNLVSQSLPLLLKDSFQND